MFGGFALLDHSILIPVIEVYNVANRISTSIKAWFSYVWKIQDDRGFCCFPTVPDFAD